MFILIFLAIVIGGSLLLYALRAPRFEQGAPFAAGSRETLLLANNLLLVSACGMVLLGTLYPLLADALDLGKISVGPPYFGFLFVLLMTPLVLLLPFGPLTRWQREQPSKVLAMLLPWAILALVLGAVAFFLAPRGPWKTAAGVAGSAWIALGTARFVWTRLRGTGRRFTPEMIGMTLAHTGIAVFLIGALLVEAQNLQSELAVKPGQAVELGGYAFRFEGVEETQGPNYVSDLGHVQVLRDGKPLARLHPEKRAYASGGQVMTEAGIHGGLFGDVYVALGEPLGAADDPNRAAGAWAVRLHIKPFVRWIWLGAALMALGGFVTALDRRFRMKPEATDDTRRRP
jgi:cytochrome c-type biogenesis protein CcmF